MIRECVREGEVLLARCVGVLDASGADALRAWSQANLADALKGATQLRLDLRAVDGVRAAGLGALLALNARTQALGARLTLAGAQGALRSMLTLTRFDLACEVVA